MLKSDYYYASEEEWIKDSNNVDRYNATFWIRVKYKGKDLWITKDHDVFNWFVEMKAFRVVNNKDFTIYSYPNRNSEVAGEIIRDDIVYLSSTNKEWNLVRFGFNKYGWIKKLDEDIVENDLEYIKTIDRFDEDFILPLEIINGEDDMPEEDSLELTEESMLGEGISDNYVQKIFLSIGIF